MIFTFSFSLTLSSGLLNIRHLKHLQAGILPPACAGTLSTIVFPWSLSICDVYDGSPCCWVRVAYMTVTNFCINLETLPRLWGGFSVSRSILTFVFTSSWAIFTNDFFFIFSATVCLQQCMNIHDFCLQQCMNIHDWEYTWLRISEIQSHLRLFITNDLEKEVKGLLFCPHENACLVTILLLIHRRPFCMSAFSSEAAPPANTVSLSNVSKCTVRWPWGFRIAQNAIFRQ